ncbi:glycosyl hydrolase family 18 protein [Cytophagaceae bacterium YF14B1]|uniref:chitinase n=1 Tax=Xanthocytophaga flava TaxID=3048013 RepID=A0AAE3QS54_9BACT|nr:glycosyl hydrolase family 18 protein [Xanthocytophaga flavus]MDJ1481854.1 glycosyl hydrolase family 18 protein [Xanthocytophaga flavus]
MKYPRLLTVSFLVFLLFTYVVSLAQNSKKISNSAFKIIGYYPLQSTYETDTSEKLNLQVPFEKLTHINLWFINPDSQGNFTQNFSGVASFVEEAHAKQVKVLFSIGGGSRHLQYRRLLATPNRSLLIQKLVSLTLTYQLDGIDVDMEGADIDENYEQFVVELATALRKHNKLITAAIAIYYKDQLTDKALAQYDFVNIMSYDRTGPWSPDKPGPHSTYAHAEEDLSYFGKTRGITKDKMTLGVPFYGYGYGEGMTAISMNYNEIQSSFSGSDTKDEWKMPDGRTIYYNGRNTIKRKTKLAKQKASGIMIWQLPGDATGSSSLLDVIFQTAY